MTKHAAVPRINIGLRIDAEDLAVVDALAEAAQIGRSEMLRRLIDQALSGYDSFGRAMS